MKSLSRIHQPKCPRKCLRKKSLRKCNKNACQNSCEKARANARANPRENARSNICPNTHANQGFKLTLHANARTTDIYFCARTNACTNVGANIYANARENTRGKRSCRRPLNTLQHPAKIPASVLACANRIVFAMSRPGRPIQIVIITFEGCFMCSNFANVYVPFRMK